MGLNIFISSGGGLISGGQRQKLLLARALVRQPKILILDEALNSLDNRVRNQIIDNLEVLGITRIIIAHNLNTFQKADRIFVLEEGSIIESGSFEELAQKEGLFQTFLEIQTL